MVLKWHEINEYNELVTHNSHEINTKNVCMYANKNCRHCNGRGMHEYSLGKGYRYYEESLRILTCVCVDKHLAKLQNLKEKQ